MAKQTTLLGFIAGFGLWLTAVFAPSVALAQCCAPPTPPPSCNCSPPPCCTPPTPPPSSPPCCSPGHNVNIPGINVFVAASVVVNANANVSASVNAAAQGNGTVFVGGGGGGGGHVAGPGAVGVMGGLNVESGGAQRTRTAYEATRTRYEKVVIQAFCFDDRETPHPASQVSSDRDIDEFFEGEIYRCIAGSHMQVTIAKWNERISFDGGQTISCQKGEALWHVAGARGGNGGNESGGGGGGRLECRPQKPARDCNERSLLRRFGAGIKIMTLIITEKYTAYREESRESSSSSSSSSAMSLDGGVGGVVY